MTIGIIGADDRAVKIARMLKHSGHTICFSDPRDERMSRAAAAVVGEDTFATTPYRQAATCDTLVLTVPWQDLERTLAALGSYKDGIVVDATRPPDLGRLSGAELLARKLDNRHIVKAFVEPLETSQSIKVASDDPEARAEVEALIAACGRQPLDAGPLANARGIERGATVQSSP